MDKTLYKAREILEGKYNEKQEVTVRGWIAEIDEANRTMTIRDGTGYIQVSFSNGAYREISEIGKESFVEIKGMVNLKNKIPLINVIRYNVLKQSVDYPSPEELLRSENRHLFITNPKIIAINNIKDTVIKTIREYFDEKGYREIPFPTGITKTAPEDPMTTFDIRFHDHRAHLTQTTKPYLEAVMRIYEKVWTHAHTYRQEKIKSRKHLSEFSTIEIQEAFSKLEDMMGLVEDIFCVTVNTVVDENIQELETLGRDTSVLHVKPPLRRMSYEKARSIINQAYIAEVGKGFEMESGKGFNSKEEDMLCAHYKFPFLVTGFPESSTPFYIKPDPENPDISRFFGLYASIAGEVATGGEVITSYELIRDRMIERRFSPSVWGWYADLRKAGLPENSTAGIGLERFLMHITGSEDITDVVLFPRVYGKSPVP